MLASDGLYAQRRTEVQAVVDAGPDCALVDIASNHNVPMTHPSDLTDIILDLLRDHSPIVDGGL